ncbi:tripartite tricarboxylate transporter substrate-binding protein [Falsiroseomonas sp. E2-1-a20]|uniref:tripartite tricarboxylate transporter substrate-binding protein n=1 Tax=Falsiroseomonas sp. E2-1-a20 TaxID=3239300 RepID=UPI003F3272D9
MQLPRRQVLRWSAAALPLAAAAQPFARAAQPPAPGPQAYPSRPVRVIVPFAPGGPNDLAARIIAQKLSDQLGKPFHVDNIGGAGGNIGMGQAARAAPDGHTLLVAAPNLVINPSLFGQVPYDVARDFAPVTIAVAAPTLLAVHPSLPVRDVAGLIALIRANPRTHSYASPGIGTPPHLVGEMFRLSLGLDLVHAPFTSGGLAIGSAVAGHTPVSFGALPPAVPHVRDGRLRALAITSGRRAEALPGIPTMAEAGHPDVAADIWTAVLVPTGTPDAIVTLLHAEIGKLLALPDVQARLAGLGFDRLALPPAESAAQFQAEGTKWARLIRDAGIRAQ